MISKINNMLFSMSGHWGKGNGSAICQKTQKAQDTISHGTFMRRQTVSQSNVEETQTLLRKVVPRDFGDRNNCTRHDLVLAIATT